MECGARRAAALGLWPEASVKPRASRPSRPPATTSPGLCGCWSLPAPNKLLQKLQSTHSFFGAESANRTVTAEKSSLRAFQRYLAHPSTRRQSGDLAAGARARAQSWEPVGCLNLRHREGVINSKWVFHESPIGRTLSCEALFWDQVKIRDP